MSIFAVIAGTLALISFNNYNKKILVSTSHRIEDSFASPMNYVENLIDYISQKISAEKNLTPELASSLLKHELITDPDFQKQFSWTMFHWIDKDNRLYFWDVIEKKYKTVDLTNERSYLNHVRTVSSKMFFSKPNFGIPTRQWILPSGYGVFDSNNNYLGTIGFGFSLSNLKKTIEKEIDNEFIRFVIINQDKDIILSSSSDSSYIQNNFLEFISKKTSESNGILEFYEDENQTLVKNYGLAFKNYPFTLLIWFDDQIYLELTKKVFSSISGFIFAGVVLLLVLLYYRKVLINPVLELTFRASTIKSGNVDNAESNYNINEFNILAEAINSVGEYISELIDVRKKLKDSNEQLEEKVKERTAELEKALRIKTDILNNISHEVRTPIQGVTAISQGLVDSWRGLKDTEKFAYAKDVAKSAMRLFSISNNILDLSKISAGKMTFDMEVNDLKECVDDIIEECKLLYLSGKKIEMRLIIENGIETKTVFDKNKIMQVLRNLFANAIKFTEQGEIVAKLYHKSKNIFFEIIDSGVGIEKNEINKLFEPFYQNNNSKKYTTGTGLGLTISKEIINSHNGKIMAVYNKSGAKFVFSLPLHELESRKASHIKTSLQNRIKKKLKIVIIDDEEIAHKSLDFILSDLNSSIINMYSGEEGLEYINSNSDKIDIILLDLMLPGISGIEVLRYLIDKKYNQKFKIIIQSGNIVSAEEMALIRGNDIQLVSKPYIKDEIISKII